ncbi:protein kinase [Diaporthe helianthi]|uniref:Protein kinase n=1 Tax=Diaporthe helianthi TaxID=158607 RepID=A0A2P5HMS9_DIAHE|nr:protein kinase [Diaporthe helianthi]
MTAENIRYYLSNNGIAFEEHHKEILEHVCGYTERSHSRLLSRRIFAILLLIEEPRLIMDFIEQGIDDGDLPLSKIRIVHNSVDGDVRDYLARSTIDGPIIIDKFCEWTGRQAPDSHPVHKFEKDVILPWTEYEDHYSGHSDVFRVKIHNAHRRFHVSDEQSFALKSLKTVLPQHRERDFRLEVKALLKVKVEAVQNSPLSPDMQQQQSPTVYNLVPEDDEGKDYGRHGDIKPENILWFKQDKSHPEFGILKLSDFGLTTFHRAWTTAVNAEEVRVTHTYSAPEQQTEETLSRPFDVWSLGCIILEFVTWILLGSKGLTTFEDKRYLDGGIKSPRFSLDNFFTVFHTENQPQAQAKVKPSVESWINKLKKLPQCSQFLIEVLNYIQNNMLLVQKDRRDTAMSVSEHFKTMLLKCKKNEGYALRREASELQDRGTTIVSELEDHEMREPGSGSKQAKHNQAPEPENLSGADNEPEGYVQQWLQISWLRNGLQNWRQELDKMIAHSDALREMKLYRLNPGKDASDSKETTPINASFADDAFQVETLVPGDSEEARKLEDAGRRIHHRLLELRGEYDEHIRACGTDWNKVGRDDALTNRKISQSSIDIAEATRRDGERVRTIAILTMVFLPATFVATVFSMTFFNWTPGEGEAVLSPYIWVYAVGTAIFTCLTLGSWYFYGQHRQRHWRRSDDTSDSVQQQGNESSGDVVEKEHNGFVQRVDNIGIRDDKD